MENYPSYKAPAQDGVAACWPEAGSVKSWIASNREQLNQPKYRWLDVSLSEIRSETRLACFESAYEYERWYRTDSLDRESTFRRLADRSVFVSGHQPELFHPGVWFKNFLLADLAREHDGLGINILIDHDLARGVRLEFPALDSERNFTKSSVEIAPNLDHLPWESAVPADWKQVRAKLALIASSTELVTKQRPMLMDIVPYIEAAIEQRRSLGAGIAAGRHAIELRNGLKNFELPFSHLTRLSGWKIFVGEVLSRLVEFSEIYNRVLEEYRRQHRIRNHAQPLPPLDRNADWLEAPFWVYSNDNSLRRSLWIRADGERVQLGDASSVLAGIEAKENSAAEWIRALTQLADSGISLRPRALTTTLFLRMTLADLFIHGIGGAKYDQISDQIMNQFWGVLPSVFLTATATCHLPIPQTEAPPISGSTTSRRLRDWKFSPEQTINSLEKDMSDLLGVANINLAPNPYHSSQGDSTTRKLTMSQPELVSLLAAKHKLIQNIPAAAKKQGWHAEVQRVNDAIRTLYPNMMENLRKQDALATELEHEQRLRRYREFSFALFAEDTLVTKLQDLSRQVMPRGGS